MHTFPIQRNKNTVFVIIFILIGLSIFSFLCVTNNRPELAFIIVCLSMLPLSFIANAGWSGQIILQDFKLKVCHRHICNISEINLNYVAINNIADDLDFQPKQQLDGFQSQSLLQNLGVIYGYYFLRSGIKAHMHITDFSKVVMIPTQKDFCILVSPNNPEEFIAALKEAHANS